MEDFAEIERHVNLSVIGSRRLAAELDAAVRKGGNRLTTPEISTKFESLYHTPTTRI